MLGAGVLVRSFEKIVGADTGVRDAERVLAGLVGLPSDKYATPAARAEFFARLDTRLRTIAATEDVWVASTLPTRGIRVRPIGIDGRPSASEARESAQVMTAGAGYFRTMGQPIITGRDFTDNDDATAPLVVMVNERFAERFWPGGDALGKRLRTVDQNVPGPWRIVVGVVPNIMQGDATRQTFQPVAYVPFRQQPSARAFIFVYARARHLARRPRPCSRNANSIRTSLPRTSVRWTRDSRSTATGWTWRISASTPHWRQSSPWSRSCLLPWGYSPSLHTRSASTRAIGVQMAIGATTRDIARMVIREGMRPVAIGLVAGLVAAAATNRVLQSQLVGVSPSRSPDNRRGSAAADRGCADRLPHPRQAGGDGGSGRGPEARMIMRLKDTLSRRGARRAPRFTLL